MFCACKISAELDPLNRLSKNFSDAELRELHKHANVPNAIMSLHGKRLRDITNKDMVTGLEAVQIDNTISRLTDHMGKAERIKTTIFPVTYTILVEYLLYLFILLLPFGLIDYFGYTVGPLLICVSAPFFLLEKTAINLQNPFNNNKTDIAMITISKTIELNLNQMIENEEFEYKSEIPENGSFYSM